MAGPRGRLISIEGLDGAGKTTLAEGLAASLTDLGLRVERLREPGGVLISERIRDLVSDPDLEMAPLTEAMLFAAARAQLCVERIRPLLDEGAWVLLDRFVDSSLAYQGGGRDLGVETVARLNEIAVDGCRPDRTLLLRLDLATGRERLDRRGTATDRFEREHDAFFDKVGGAYDALATADAVRFRVLDAHLPVDQVRAEALNALRDLLPTTAGA
ncbi:MAG: dTMP kinase [Solirubrobacteraceae bacterium]|nr:dTMP kinase [Solirubrobacteraceae bacterium]